MTPLSRNTVVSAQLAHALRGISDQHARVLQSLVKLEDPAIGVATLRQRHVLHEGTALETLQAPLHVVKMIRVQVAVLATVRADVEKRARARSRSQLDGGEEVAT